MTRRPFYKHEARPRLRLVPPAPPPVKLHPAIERELRAREWSYRVGWVLTAIGLLGVAWFAGYMVGALIEALRH